MELTPTPYGWEPTVAVVVEKVEPLMIETVFVLCAGEKGALTIGVLGVCDGYYKDKKKKREKSFHNGDRVQVFGSAGSVFGSQSTL